MRLNKKLALLIVSVLTLPLSAVAQVPKVKLVFTPEAEKFTAATKEYQELWQAEGDRIIEAIEQMTGFKFVESEIKAVIFEGASSSGFRDTPMMLRASYTPEIKRATLVHELGHRHNTQLAEREQSVDEHRVLFLWLYEAWVKLYGKEFADRAVQVEKGRKGIYDYETAWNWALALSPAERAAKFKGLVNKNQTRLKLQ